MKNKIDILDRLQDEETYVQLSLSNGKKICGLPQCVVFDEDENGWDTIKKITFEPYPFGKFCFLGIEDVASYRCISKNELLQLVEQRSEHAPDPTL